MVTLPVKVKWSKYIIGFHCKQAINQILCRHEAMNGCKILKILKACFEDVNIVT